MAKKIDVVPFRPELGAMRISNNRREKGLVSLLTSVHVLKSRYVSLYKVEL